MNRKSFHGREYKDSFPFSIPPQALPSKLKWTTRLKNTTNNYNPALSLVSAFPKKWCNFMRKNSENSVYKSESFRFIQKTSSLEPLVPSRNTQHHRRVKLPEVPVNEDYVEPLDQVQNQAEVDDVKLTQFLAQSSTGEGGQNCQGEPEYNEIKESYNAPYYYSDTLKGAEQVKKLDSEPAYCSPCQSFKRLIPQSQSLRSLDKIITLHQKPCLKSHSCSQDKLVNSNSFPETPLDSPITSMARKRYETAFLPNSRSRSSHVQSPDVDSLLLSIEGTYLKSEDDMQAGANKNYDSFSNRRRCNSVNYSSREPSISLHYQERDNLLVPRSSTSITTTHTHTHVHMPSSPAAETFISSSAARTIPLSEPLLQKRYANKISLSQYSTQSSSGCSTTNSSSPSQLSEIQRKGERGKTVAVRRNCHLSLMKDNSISSLESIDSMKSDDLKYSLKSSFSVCGNQPNLKLLSPISDKSPLEPSMGIEDSQLEHKIGRSTIEAEPYDIFCRNVLSEAQELTNVPWEMPKLKRRLKLLVDSGISLDFPHNREPEIQSTEENNKQVLCLDKQNQRHDSNLTEPKTGSFLTNNPFTESACAVPSEVPHIYNSLRSSASLRLPVNNHPFVEFTGESEHHPNYGYRTHVNLYSDPVAPNDTDSALQGLQDYVPSYMEKGKNAYGSKPDRCRMRLDFNQPIPTPIQPDFDPTLELELQDWFHGAITRSEAEGILRTTKEGSFLVRNCESSTYNRFSLSLKSSRGFIHVRIEPNSLGTYSLGEQEFQSVPHLILYFMSHRLPIKGAEHVKLKHPIIIHLL